jgi:hypothetical protein
VLPRLRWDWDTTPSHDSAFFTTAHPCHCIPGSGGGSLSTASRRVRRWRVIQRVEAWRGCGVLPAVKSVFDFSIEFSSYQPTRFLYSRSWFLGFLSLVLRFLTPAYEFL